MDFVIGPEAYLALGITIFAAVMTIVWMVGQFVDALRHG
jgi:hypothetical protein